MRKVAKKKNIPVYSKVPIKQVSLLSKYGGKSLKKLSENELF